MLREKLRKKVTECSTAFEECFDIYKERLDLANKKAEHEIAKREQKIAEHEATIRQLEDAQSIQHNEKAEAAIEKRERAQKIVDLEATIRQMQEKQALQNIAQPPTVSGQIVINGKFFSIVQAGMLMEQGERNVSLFGKTWKQTEFWFECGTVDMLGGCPSSLLPQTHNVLPFLKLPLLKSY